MYISCSIVNKIQLYYICKSSIKAIQVQFKDINVTLVIDQNSVLDDECE